MPRRARQRRTAAEIQTILSDYEDSGLSRRQYASRRDIPLSTLDAWIRKHGTVSTAKRPVVIPVGAVCGSSVNG